MGINFNPLSKQVTVGGHTFTVTALPLGVIRHEIVPLSERFNGETVDDEIIEVMLKCVHQSVSKNDPDITLEAIENNLMMADLAILFREVVNISGMNREDAATGEALRQPRLNEAGATFTDVSQQLPDGHISISTPS